jgi:transcriptional regulator with XRE-family HTH domain
MPDNETDPVMAVARARFEKSKLSLDELGLKMGYPKESARKSAWQFLNKTSDPRLSMLRKFAQAVGVKLSTLVKD